MQSEAAVDEGISKEILDKLFATLKSWASDMDAFRYEMFAKRLIAAEYGRPDAVAWAQAWYDNLIAEERARAEQHRLAIEEREQRNQAARAEFKAGKCGNPHYQAFLDTVEHPELLENNAPYFAWVSSVQGAFSRQPGIRDLDEEERQMAWQAFLQKHRDEHLAPRMNGVATPLNFKPVFID